MARKPKTKRGKKVPQSGNMKPVKGKKPGVPSAMEEEAQGKFKGWGK